MRGLADFECGSRLAGRWVHVRLSRLRFSLDISAQSKSATTHKEKKSPERSPSIHAIAGK
jgi:hypothetical protein